jgi:GWxTD domain-containing protein
MRTATSLRYVGHPAKISLENRVGTMRVPMFLQSFVIHSLVLTLVAFFGAQLAVAQVAPRHGGKELVEVYRNWTDDDVPWIITAEERSAFHRLANDQERDEFIEQFWYRRDPTPDTLKNEFEDEYYKRVLYANDHFAAGGEPGWRTDRGRLYIEYGPPDKIATGARNLPRGAAAKTESWKYKYLEDVGTDVVFDFADRRGNDDYELELPDFMSELPPAARLRDWPGFKGSLEAYVGGVPQPKIAYVDLFQVLTHRVNYNGFPVALEVSAQRATTNISLARLNITVPRALLLEGQIGRGEMRAFVRIVRMDGKTAAIREASVPPPTDAQAEKQAHLRIEVPLFPRRYRLEVVVEDVETEFKKTIVQALKVPGREE